METRLHEVKMIPRESILVEDRVRHEFGEIKDLAESIKQYGLLHAIVVTNEDPPHLVAGGRRFLAMELLNWPLIPCHVLQPDEVSPLRLMELELEENIQRLDLSWPEKCMATYRIQQVKEEIHGKKLGRGTAPGWSPSDTAKMLNSSATNVVKDIQMALALEQVPELRECATQKEAETIFKRMIETVAQEELVRKAKEESPVSNLELCKAYHVGDTLEFMAGLPDSSREICDIDPPYNLAMRSRDFHKKWSLDDVDLETIGIEAMDPDKFVAFMRSVLAECHRILSADGWIILWHAMYPWGPIFMDLVEECGFHCVKPPAIWVKGQGKSRMPSVCLGSAYEPFFYAYKGMPTLARKGHTNTFTFRPVPNQSRRHIAEKPIELMQDILQTFVVPGSRVLVPFCGSGNTLLAAHNLGMPADGCDLSAQFKMRYDGIVIKGGPYRSYATGIPNSITEEIV